MDSTLGNRLMRDSIQEPFHLPRTQSLYFIFIYCVARSYWCSLAINNIVALTDKVWTADGILSITQPQQSENTRPPVTFSSSMSNCIWLCTLAISAPSSLSNTSAGTLSANETCELSAIVCKSVSGHSLPSIESSELLRPTVSRNLARQTSLLEHRHLAPGLRRHNQKQSQHSHCSDEKCNTLHSIFIHPGLAHFEYRTTINRFNCKTAIFQSYCSYRGVSNAKSRVYRSKSTMPKGASIYFLLTA